jgi:hypothetical protein
MLLLDYIRHRMFLKHPMSLFAKGNKHTAFAQEEILLAYLTFLLFKILLNKELQLLVAFLSDIGCFWKNPMSLYSFSRFGFFVC